MKTQSALTRIVAILTLAVLLAGPLAATTSAAEKNKPEERSHTRTSLALSRELITQGDPIVLILTATVTVSGEEAATGTVRFSVGGTKIADVEIATIGGSQTATATFDAGGLGDGGHTFHAHYLGKGSFNASNANAHFAVAAKPAPPAPPSDNTAPVITPSGVGSLAASDWYTSDVSVSWSVTDPESPILSHPGCDTVTIATDTTGTTLTCTATSAGGTSSSTRTIKRDATAPTIGARVTTPSNAQGWNNTDVTISFACDDATSGVAACAQTVTLSTDGAGQTVTGSATDNAGNAASASLTVNIDKTAPSIKASANAGTVANALGWYNTAVTISFACDDATSGVARCADAVTLSADGAGQTVTGGAADNAGNAASATLTVNLDKTAPTIGASVSTPANAQGWNNTAVTIAFACDDATSGVAACAQPVTLSTEGAGQTVTGSATDIAGNGATSATLTVNIDKTAPTIAFVGATEYTVDQLVSITCSSSDALSDVASSTCSAARGDAYSFVFGTKTVTAAATDRAGNTSTASTTFTVRVTTDSLCILTNRFAMKPLGSSLCAQLNAAASAGARGNAKAKANALDAYTREVNAQAGKAFTAEKAAILIRLVGQL